MKRAKEVLLLVAIATVLQVKCASAQQSPPQHLLDALQEITGVPGMSAAVSENNKIIWAGSAGLADVGRGLEITDDTKFRLASVSKLFTAALVLKLSDEGLLDLDQDIQTYVPEWQGQDGAIITLRQLAAHIAGLDHYSAEDRFDAARSYQRLSDSISIYGHKPLLFSPGEDYSYSSYGYALMGAAIEAVTGQSFNEAMNNYVLEPFGLHNTSIENTEILPPATATLYSNSEATGQIEIARNNQQHVNGATGMLSTPSDLLIFAAAYSSGKIVSEESKKMAWAPATLNNGAQAGETRYKVGFGWRIGRDWDGRPVVHHAGVTPGARSILTINQNTGTAAALLSNASWTSRMETTGELIAAAATQGARLKRGDCPVGAWTYDGMFIEDKNAAPAASNAYGRIDISFSGNICRGEIQPGGAIADWLTDRKARTSSMKLTLVAKRKNQASVFAMATPWGAFPLHLTGEGNDQNFIGNIAGRSISLNLAPVTTIEN